MLIEILKEPILIGGVPVLKDIRMNIVDNKHQMRLKATCLSDGAEEHVDLVIYNWTIPKLDKLAISISVDGKEMLRNIIFDLKISYDFFKRKWKVKGRFGTRNIDRDLESIVNITTIIQEGIQMK